MTSSAFSQSELTIEGPQDVDAGCPVNFLARFEGEINSPVTYNWTYSFSVDGVTEIIEYQNISSLYADPIEIIPVGFGIQTLQCTVKDADNETVLGTSDGFNITVGFGGGTNCDFNINVESPEIIVYDRVIDILPSPLYDFEYTFAFNWNQTDPENSYFCQLTHENGLILGNFPFTGNDGSDYEGYLCFPVPMQPQIPQLAPVPTNFVNPNYFHQNGGPDSHIWCKPGFRDFILTSEEPIVNRLPIQLGNGVGV